ncbi:Mu transposase C-terminal domain-containing protein [Streptomyces sp. NPDC004111]|uniref:Mu transposase C-terminal domain-containing protein n=1 Tax=Streptomyces sp. NPDC004111 TaxID=3364690 RepID=UPI0036C988E0
MSVAIRSAVVADEAAPDIDVKDTRLRAAAVAHLLALERAGMSGGGQVAISADSFRCTKRTVYRWMARARAAGGQYVPAERKRHHLTQEMHDAYALFCGRAKEAYDDLKKRGRLGPKPFSYDTFCRMIRRELTPAYRAGLRGGEVARRAYDLRCERPRGHRNEAWEADHKEADVWVDVEGTPRKPWITLFVGCSHDGIMGWAVTPHEASSDAVLLAFRDAVQTGGDHGPFGGLPALVRVDGGKDFRCDALKESFGKFGIAHVILPRGHPELKGTVEAINGAMKEMLFVGLPGFTERPTNGVSLKRKPKSVEGLLTFERFVHELRTWVHQWNYEHRIRNLENRTPKEVWDADLTVLREVDPAALHAYSLKAARGDRVIGGSGIAWNNAHYLTHEPWMSQHIGDKVTVRYQPHHTQQIEVYDARTGRYLGSATRQDEISAQQRKLLRAASSREARRLKQALDRTAKQLRERFAATTEPAAPQRLDALTRREADAQLRTLGAAPDLYLQPQDLGWLPEPSPVWHQDGRPGGPNATACAATATDRGGPLLPRRSVWRDEDLPEPNAAWLAAVQPDPKEER